MIEPARDARRPGAGFAVVALGAVAVLVALGTWQVERLHWKRALIAERQAMLARPPVDLPASGRIADFQPLRLTGTFRHDAELLVGPAVRRGVSGWRVVTPLRLAGGRTVLVERGWVPHALGAAARPAAGQVAEQVTVRGFARFPGPRGPFAPANDPAKGQWLRVSPAEMAAHLRLENAFGWWLAADDAPNPGGWPRGGGAVGMPPNNHLQYAVTWYGLALAAAVIAMVFWRRGRAGGA